MGKGADKAAKPIKDAKDIAAEAMLMLVPALQAAQPTKETALTAIDKEVFFKFICLAFCAENFPKEIINLILWYALFNQFAYDITVAPTHDLSALSLFSNADDAITLLACRSLS